jgi:DNA-binding transcriptional MocR family regulator
MRTWTPDLGTDGKTLCVQVVEAVRRDIVSGALEPGVRMPTQRDLARDLGIGIGTVTRAYGEAERLGLLCGRVGRGTFVAGGIASAATSIDLSMNMPSLAPAAGRLAEALARLRRTDLAEQVGLAPHAGLDRHRQAAADWLARAARFENADWRRLLICVGAQQAMSLALDEICRPGDSIMVEAATFHGLRAIAAHRGYALTGLPMDRDGLCPEALDRAAAETGSRVVYVQPTLQNPTARSMSRARREDIVRVARRHQLWILEGDIYAALAGAGGGPAPDLPPLASLAPERTFYASSVSKTLAPGLRCGFLVAPDPQHFERLLGAMRATCFSPCTLGAMVAAQWIADGTADTILAEVAREAAGRTALACGILGARLERPSFPASLHAWLPAGELEAERIAGRARDQGVTLTPPSALLVDGAHVSGLRLCLNAPPDRRELERALHGVAAALTQDGTRQSVV